MKERKWLNFMELIAQKFYIDNRIRFLNQFGI